MSTLDEIGLQYDNKSIPLPKIKYSGGDKCTNDKKFTLVYDSLFKQYFPSSGKKSLRKTFRLLELGINYGRSLAMFSDYFQYGEVHGIDKSLKLFNNFRNELERAGAFKHENVYVYEMDLTDEKLSTKIKTLPDFDVIIDDALHLAEQQYKNFITFWPKLNRGGIYVIEDITEPDKFLEIFSVILASFLNPLTCNKKTSLTSLISEVRCCQNLFIIVKKN